MVSCRLPEMVRLMVPVTFLSALCNRLSLSLTSEEMLRNAILRSDIYNPEALPLAYPGLNKPEVNLTLFLINLHHLNEKKQVLTTFSRIKAEWYDRRVQWKPVDYDNLTKIYVLPHKVWTPEMTILNAEKHVFLDFSRFLVLVMWDGHMIWTPAGLFETTCAVDVTLYPYDYQRCGIKVGTWALSQDDIILRKSVGQIKLDYYTPLGAWKILRTVARVEDFLQDTDTGGRHQCVAFYIILERIHDFYSLHLVLPSAAMAVLVPMIFLTPAASGEKITLGVSVVLAFSVFLLFAVDQLPETSFYLPLMGICLMIIMIIATSSLVLSIINLNLYHRPASRPMSSALRWFTFGLLARLFCMGDDTPEVRPGKVSVVSKKGSPPQKKGENNNGKDKKDHVHNDKQNPSVHVIKVAPNGEMQAPRSEGAVVSRHAQPSGVMTQNGSWKRVARLMDRFYFFLCLVAMVTMMLFLIVKVNLQTVPLL